MDTLLDRIAFAPVTDLAGRFLLETATHHFYAFILVMVRLSGLMTVGPLFGQSLVPANVRILLVLALSFLVTPLVHNLSGVAFEEFDANRDGRLERAEVPVTLERRFDDLLRQSGKQPGDTLSAGEFRFTARIPQSVLEFGWIGAGEFALGFVLGLGVLAILSGLQLAGEVIDQQTGIALGEVSSPGLEINGSVTGQFLFLFATTVLLLAKPLGFHLMLVSAMLETFQTLPPGDAFVTRSAAELLVGLIHQSLVLGVQVAAPLLAMMSLVALTMGFLGHTVPQINVLVVGFPVRAMTSLLVLAASLSGIAKTTVDLVPGVIDSLRNALAGL